jgi:tetratricopeptide (TPR) repeat protein
MLKAYTSAGLRLGVAAALLLGSLASWHQDRLLAVMGLASAAAISAFTRPAILAYNRARERWLNRDLLGALQQLTLALQRDPRLANAYLLRGQIRLELGQLAQALEDFDQAAQLIPRRSEPCFYRSLIYQARGDLQGATAELTKLVRLHPSPTYHLRLAELYLQQGSLPSALAPLDEAVARDPTWALAYACRAQVYGYLGEWEAAVADWSQAIRWDPRPAHYYRRGIAYAWADRYLEAIADLSRSLEAEPGQPCALYLRGNLLYELGELGAALDDYDQAFRLEASGIPLDLADEYGLYARGLAYRNMGDLKTAIASWQAALHLGRQRHNRVLQEQVQRALRQLQDEDGDP